MGEGFNTDVRRAEEEVCFQLCGSSIGYLQEQEGVEWCLGGEELSSPPQRKLANFGVDP